MQNWNGNLPNLFLAHAKLSLACLWMQAYIMQSLATQTHTIPNVQQKVQKSMEIAYGFLQICLRIPSKVKLQPFNPI